LVLAALIAGVLVASCDQQSAEGKVEPQRSSAGMRRVQGDELRSLVRGSTMTWEYPDADAPNRWIFGCTAEWSARGGFSAVSGAYDVMNDEICVQGQSGPGCHRLYMADGYFLSPQQPPPQRDSEAVHRVRFARNIACP
ncbi:MAG: hypothetical protein ABL932_22270, partial [Terricaulis sp.]